MADLRNPRSESFVCSNCVSREPWTLYPAAAEVRASLLITNRQPVMPSLYWIPQRDWLMFVGRNPRGVPCDGICCSSKPRLTRPCCRMEGSIPQRGLVGDMDRRWPHRRRRGDLLERRQHQVAGGRSSEMESSVRRFFPVEPAWIALWGAVRTVGEPLRTGPRCARHPAIDVPTCVSVCLLD